MTTAAAARAPRNRPLALAALVVLGTLAGCAEGPALQVSEARVRQLIPGQETTVGYLTLRNTGARDRVLTAVASDAARAVEMHTTVRDGDVVRMRRLSEVVIPAGETVRFEPGGRHLMLFGVTDLKDPVQVSLTVVTRDGEPSAGRGTEIIPVRFEIVPFGTD